MFSGCRTWQLARVSSESSTLLLVNSHIHVSGSLRPASDCFLFCCWLADFPCAKRELCLLSWLNKPSEQLFHDFHRWWLKIFLSTPCVLTAITAANRLAAVSAFVNFPNNNRARVERYFILTVTDNFRVFWSADSSLGHRRLASRRWQTGAAVAACGCCHLCVC